MSHHAEVLVCRSEDPCRAAANVLAYLVDEGIIEPMPTSSGLGTLAHRPSHRAEHAVYDASELPAGSANGMEVRLPGRVELFFPADGGSPWVTCPRCDRALEKAKLVENLARYNPFKGAPLVRCKGCGEERELAEFSAHDSAFGNLAFYFWNWPPLRDEVIAEMAARCGAPLVPTYEQI